jgi:hypothetical protein
MAMAVALVAIAMIGAADAQMPGAGGRPGGTPSGRGPMGDGGMQREPAPGVGVDQLQAQLVALEEDLKLAPAQRKPWSAYADRVRQLADDITRNRQAVRFPKGTAPQQFDFLADTMRNRLTAFEDVAEAGKALYATLAPEQQEVADRRLARIAVSLLDVGAGGGSLGGGPPDGGGRGMRGPPGGGR